jgi:hypothetical protein
MHSELRAVIDDAYDVFSGYRVRHSLSVCHFNSCMTVENEQLLLKAPLREIPSRLLAEYTGSAHSWDDGPVAREMRHFLPRYFELLALDDPPDTCGIDICLRRLAQADWCAKWPDRECAVIASSTPSCAQAWSASNSCAGRSAGGSSSISPMF